MTEALRFDSEPRNAHSMADRAATTPFTSGKKLLLADHRYGREEMLSLYQENPILPSRIAWIPDLVRTEALQPLALLPLTEQEQYVLAGTVNSHTVYNMRGGGGVGGAGGGTTGGPGRGFYPQRGGKAGRGRRPRQDQYWATTPDETSSRGGVPPLPGGRGGGGFQRQSSEPYGGTDGRVDGPGGSRASRDTNWRFSSSGATSPGSGGQGEGEGGGGWGKHWHPSATSPVKPLGGRSWREGSAWKEQRWQALPEWATDDSGNDGGGKDKGRRDKTGSNPVVGNFDSSGHFTMSEKEGNDREEDASDQLPEDVFEDEPGDTERDHYVVEPSSKSVSREDQQLQPSHQPQPLVQQQAHVQELAERDIQARGGASSDAVSFGAPSTSSGDSMEEMARRFEKAAEAVLSTDEETPSPSPNVVQFFPTVQKQEQYLQQQQQQQQLQEQQRRQHGNQEPSKPSQQPVVKQQAEEASSPSVDMMTSWVYCDPQGEVQGPFTNEEMNNWFRAGYFTMDLMVRRLCDVVMLPLGQVIRAWGRVPFTPGPSLPAMQTTDPYLQQLLQPQKQSQVVSPQPDSTHHKEPSQALAPNSSAATPSDPLPHSQSPASRLWGLDPDPPTPEEQWPELFSKGEPSTAAYQAVPRAAQNTQDKEEEEERKRIENERRRLEEEQARAEEEERRRQEKIEEERKRKEEKRRLEERKKEEERRRQEELELMKEKQRQAEKLQRQLEEEEERKRLREVERERKRIEEMRIAEEKRREAELLQQQRELEEAQRMAEEEEERQRKKEMKLALSPQQRGWNTSAQEPLSPQPLLHQQQQQQPTPSLLEIQREERIIAEQEKRQLEEQRMLQQHTSPIGGGWASLAASNRPTSFLDIQKEQQVLGGGGAGNRKSSQRSNVAAGAPPSFSWSKVACANKQQQPVRTAPPSSKQPKQQNSPLQPNMSYSKPVEQSRELTAFWEVESNAVSDKGRGGYADKEEEKVRKLFSSSPDEVFTNWCAKELANFDVDVDPATFVSLLLEVESTYEVHDYIRSFLGETDEVHAFAKLFLEKRQRLKRNQQQKTHQRKTPTDPVTVTHMKGGGGGGGGGGVLTNVAAGNASARNAAKKKKKKMQKVHPAAMLGFTVNAAERPNAGEIQSSKDAV